MESFKIIVKIPKPRRGPDRPRGAGKHKDKERRAARDFKRWQRGED